MRWSRQLGLRRAQMIGGGRLRPEVKQFYEDGYCVCRNVFDVSALTQFEPEFHGIKSGRRSFCLHGALAQRSIADTLLELANRFASQPAVPVRVIYFDKTDSHNWSLGWHQDRTIAVKRQVDFDGYNIWSKKGGVVHVEPPFDIIDKSVTLRVSVDPSDESNGALEVLLTSHLRGRLSDQDTQKLAGQMKSKLLNTEAGDVVVLATPIVHRSKSSVSNMRRRTVHIDYSWARLPKPLEWAFDY